MQENAAASHFLAFLQESITARLTLKSARKYSRSSSLQKITVLCTNSIKLAYVNFFLIKANKA
jgi:hypothetical protein